MRSYSKVKLHTGYKIEQYNKDTSETGKNTGVEAWHPWSYINFIPEGTLQQNIFLVWMYMYISDSQVPSDYVSIANK